LPIRPTSAKLMIFCDSHVTALTKLLLKVKNKKRGGVLFTLMPI